MGRSEKVTAQQIREQLEQGEYTKAELADIFKVTSDTIRNKVKMLQEDGDSIIHSNNGYFLIDKQDIVDDPENAEKLMAYEEWVMATYKAMVRGVQPVRELLPTMRRVLRINLTPEERRMLLKNGARMVAMCAMIEAQEEEAL